MKNFTNLNKFTFISLVLLSFFSMGTAWSQCSSAMAAATVSNVTSTSAKFEWVLVSAEIPGQRYHFEIRTSGVPGSDVNPSNGYVTSGDIDNGINTVTINASLTFNTVYYFYIRYDCSDILSSPWSAGTTFNTQPLQIPVATAALNVSSNNFTAKWNPVAGATSYRLDVSKSPTFAPGQFVQGYSNRTVATSSSVVNPSGGLVPSTNYYYRVRAVGSGGQPVVNVTTGNSNAITVTTLAKPLTYTIWTEAGWSQDPTFLLDAIIDANYSTATNGNFEGKSLVINAGKTLTLNSETYLLINNEITNNGTFIIENNANLVQENSDAPDNVGVATVNRQSSALFRLDYTMWSSPVTSSQTLKQFSPATNTSRFYTYNTTANNFLEYASSNTFTKGEGYLIRMPDNWVSNPDSPKAPITPTGAPAIYNGVFSGIPNNKNVDVLLETTGQGFNMVGNPYPCILSAENFLLENGDATTGEIYFWRRTNSTVPGVDVGSFYATYTLAGGVAADDDLSNIPNNYIQTGQGFLVQDNALDNVNQITFSNTQKIPDNFENQFFRQKNTSKTSTPKIERNRLWLNLTTDTGVFSQTMVSYMTDASNNVDRADGKGYNDTGVSLTSVISGGEYVIQSRSLPFTDNDIVAMNLKTPVAGTFTITLAQMDGLFLEGQNVYIKDNLTNTVNNLNEKPYTFSTEAGVFASRFEVVYKNSSLSTNNPTIDANSVVVYKSNQTLNINSGAIAMKSVALYDMSGRVIYKTENIANTKVALSDLNFQDQIVIIKITTEAGIVSKKFSWTK